MSVHRLYAAFAIENVLSASSHKARNTSLSLLLRSWFSYNKRSLFLFSVTALFPSDQLFFGCFPQATEFQEDYFQLDFNKFQHR